MGASSDAGHREVKAILFVRAAEAQRQMLSHTPALPWQRKLEMQADLHSFKMVFCRSGSSAVFDAGKKCCGAEEKEGYMKKKEPS